MPLLIITLILSSCNYSNTTKNKNVILWQEDSSKDLHNENVSYNGLRSKFDLESILLGINEDGYRFNTFIFSGTVIQAKEYQSAWIDDEGRTWGPFSRTILEVKLNKIYRGESPVTGDTIKILYPYALSLSSDDSVKIVENVEYVFVNCWVIDDTYYEYLSNYCKSAINDESINQADIIIGNAWNSVFPINEETVTVYHEYFDSESNNMSAISTIDSVTPYQSVPYEAVESGDYIQLNMEDFEKLFLNLLENTCEYIIEPSIQQH